MYLHLFTGVTGVAKADNSTQDTGAVVCQAISSEEAEIAVCKFRCQAGDL